MILFLEQYINILKGTIILLQMFTQQMPLGAIVENPIQPAILATVIDEELKNIEYTDENINEKLIIRTEKMDNMNFAGNIGLYFSIYNGSVNGQNVKIVFSFNRDYKQQIWVKNGEKTIPIIHQAKQATATTTAVSEYIDYKIITDWLELPKSNFTETAITRKDIKGTKTLEENTVFINSRETKFFKANIKYLPIGREEFFIEAFGSLGDYGNLDPWAYEQNFNSLNDGDLAGQDSWTNVTSEDIINVGNYTPYEGTKNATSTISAPTPNRTAYRRTITAVADGTVYVAMKTSTKTNLGVQYFAVRDTGGLQFDVALTNTDILVRENDTSTTAVVVSNYTADQYYVLELVFNFTTNTAKARAHNGTSWGAYSSSISMGTAPADAETIQMLAGTGGGVATVYWDTITATDPTPAPAAVIPLRQDIIIFE